MNLSPRLTYGDLDLTDVPYALEFGADIGSPENVYVALERMLQDGEVVSSERSSNRSISFTILVEGADMLALGEAEQALVLEADKPRNTLTLDPGDGFGAATVFDTFRAQVTHVRDDEHERALTRRYAVELTALPHGHSVDKIIDDAGTPPSTGTVVNNCESTTGWAVWAGQPATPKAVDTVIFSEGAGSLRSTAGVVAQGTDYNGADVTTAYNYDQVTGLSIATGIGGYMSILVRPEWPGFYYGDGAVKFESKLHNLYVTTTEDGEAEIVPVASATLANGFVRYSWPMAGSKTVTGLRFRVIQVRSGHNQPTPRVWYDALTLSTAATTDSQISKSFDVLGSARAPGSLHIAAPTDGTALGNVFAMTVPEVEVMPGFQPDARRWVVSGTTTTDATVLYGSYFTAGANYGAAGSPVFEVPVSMLVAGPYAMVALAYSAADPITVGVEARLKVGAMATGPVSTAEVTIPNTVAAWRLITVGTVNLPPTPMQNPGTDAKVQLQVKGGARIAELLMVPVAAAFSIVDCGEGTVSATGASSHLWIDSPSPTQPQGGWWRGPADERSNARSAWPETKKPGRHSLTPGRMLATLLSTKAQGPRLTIEYKPHWHTNAAL